MVLILEGSRANFTRSQLFDLLRSKGHIAPNTAETRQTLCQYIIEVVGSENVTVEHKISIEKVIHTFCTSLSRKWKKSHRFIRKFEILNDKWLQEEIIKSGVHVLTSKGPGTSGRGRPKVLFDVASNQTKRRRVQADVQSKSAEELALATKIKLYSAGKRDAAALVHRIVYSPKSATRLKRIEAKKKDTATFSAEEALALFISLKLTRSQYIGLRTAVKNKSLKNLFPSYDKILEAKKKCYPASDVATTDILAEVPLQSLLDHTVLRLAEVQKEVLISLTSSMDGDATDSNTKLQMFYQWGADGSGSQSNYKQKFENEEMDDSSIFATSIVPLQLYLKKSTNEKDILWQNPRTSSTRFCRPIRIQFIKENENVIKSEFLYIEKQISELLPTKVVIDHREFLIHHTLVKTMVDGKVCNSLSTNSSTQRCYICKAGPKDFNKLDSVKLRACDLNTYSLGLSPLHAYIRFFEFLLHIAYRLEFKTWQVRGESNKEVFVNRKQNIITSFRNEMGLLVDIPKPGFGTSNDGNTARRFFADSQLSSRITGIDKNLINKFSIVLRVLNCGFKINAERFAFETAQVYVNLYNWYPMPPSVHKILIHGIEVIKSFILPIGQLAEDAQESRHKEIKYYRAHNTRKITRKQANEDLLNILLVSSDPIISSLRTLPAKQSGPMSRNIIFLLDAPELDNDDSE